MSLGMPYSVVTAQQACSTEMVKENYSIDFKVHVCYRQKRAYMSGVVRSKNKYQ